MVGGFNHPAIGECDGSQWCQDVCRVRCLHAEQVALLKSPFSPGEKGVQMLHLKVVDGKGVPSGPPSCAECSKLIVGAGLEGMWLLHETPNRGPVWQFYPAREFHEQTLDNIANGIK